MSTSLAAILNHHPEPAYALEFEFYELPAMTNPSGARSTHWRVKKEDSDRWKLAVILLVKSKRPLKPLPRACLTLIRFSSNCPDFDGLVSGFKHIVDGLVKAGVLANDKFKNIGMPNYRWEKCPPKQGKVRIKVETIIPKCS